MRSANGCGEASRTDVTSRDVAVARSMPTVTASSNPCSGTVR